MNNIRFFIVLAFFFTASVSVAVEFPVGDAFDKDDGSGRPVFDLGSHNPSTSNEVHDPMHNALQPSLTKDIKEPHPYPDYMKKFIYRIPHPEQYRELIGTEPTDQVQSKIFKPDAFLRVQRIGVASFENKVKDPIEQKEDPGHLVAKEMSRELETVSKYSVVRPELMDGEYHMKITKSHKVPFHPPPEQRDGPKSYKKAQINKNRQKIVYDLPYPSDKIDAVMIGAVTRFSDKYQDRYGVIKRSPSSSIEFSAFLISTQTGEAIWGARFVGSQQMKLQNLWQGRHRWLNKREMTENAIKRILKTLPQLNFKP